MSRENVVRAWKDPEYRSRLQAAETAQMPGNPAGAIELSDARLESVAGGAGRSQFCTLPCTMPIVCRPKTK